MAWRQFVDWAKHRPSLLHLAGTLGRGRGHFRILDRWNAPPPAPHVPTFTNWESADLAAVWLGHASVLVRIAGKTILTDPVFSNRVGLGLLLMTGGPRRFVAPPLPIRDLPPIDVIVISHAHFDHLDRPTLARLPKTSTIVTSAGNRDLLDDLGFSKVVEVPLRQTVDTDGLRMTAVEVRHWGARTFYDTHRGYSGFVIERAGRRVLYGADTAYHEGFRSIDPVDLAIVGIGAYDPWEASHATPEQAWAMAGHCRAKYVLPMHHSTFRLSHEPMEDPIRRLVAVAGVDAERIVLKEVGQSWLMPE